MQMYHSAVTLPLLLTLMFTSASAWPADKGDDSKPRPSPLDMSTTSEPREESPHGKKPVDDNAPSRPVMPSPPLRPFPVTPMTARLTYPDTDHVIRPSYLQEDQTIGFRWMLQTSYKPPSEPKLAKIETITKYTRIKLVSVSYSLCFFTGASCDEKPNGDQIEGPWNRTFTERNPACGQTGDGEATQCRTTDDSRLEIPLTQQVTLSVDSWQGKSFNWAVKVCPTYIDLGVAENHPYRRITPEECAWAAPHKINWLLAPPTDLENYVDPDMSHVWNLIFDWSPVKGAEYYVICINVTMGDVSRGCAGSDYSPQPVKIQENSPPYRRLGGPPPGSGENGDVFIWRVAACSNKLDVPDIDKCIYSVQLQGFSWPQ